VEEYFLYNILYTITRVCTR